MSLLLLFSGTSGTVISDVGIPGPLIARGPGVGGYARLIPRSQRVSVLGFSPQVLGGVLVPTVEAQIGRKFSGFRENQAITTTGLGSANGFYDQGYKTYYRNISIDAAGGWADVANGVYDAQLLTFTNLVLASTRWTTANPIWVSFHHEQTVDNGVSQVGYPTNGTQQDFINAFRHVRSFFDSHNATVFSKSGAFLGGKIKMVYCTWLGMHLAPAAGKAAADFDPDLGSSPEPTGTSNYERYACDVYNVVDSPGVLKRGNDVGVVLDPIRDFAIARWKDWMMPEFGVGDALLQADHDNKGSFLDKVHQYLVARGENQPGVCRAVLCTIKASSDNYNVDSSPESLAAFQRIAADPYFA